MSAEEKARWRLVATGPDMDFADQADELSPMAIAIFEDGPNWKLEAWFTEKPNAALAAAILGLEESAIQIVPQEDQDWVTLSQQARPAVRAGRFWLYGAHEETTQPLGSIPIAMDAGLAFGTGHHGTTRGCLEALSAHAARRPRPVNALDLGTGTGVLAIGMAKLWPGLPVLATDIDPVAIDVTRDNLAKNACTGRIALQTAPGMAHPLIAARAPYDLIVANILAKPLIQMAGDITSALAVGGTLILSGLLQTQARQVQLAYRARGLVLKRRIDIDEWSALVLEDPA